MKKRWPIIRNSARNQLIRLGYHSRPGFLIIGAQKAGTVALYRYLRRHPHVFHPTTKEIVYFNEEGRQYLAKYPRFRPVPGIEGRFFDPSALRLSRAWYHRHFPLPHTLGRRGVTFEATPGYLYYPKAPERIFAYSPSIKLLVLLRDPVERAYSSWAGFRELALRPEDGFAYLGEQRDFPQAVVDEIAGIADDGSPMEPSYVRRGLYFEQLQRYFRHFPHNQVLVLESDSLKNDTAATLTRITQFLELAPMDWGRLSFQSHHVRRYAEPMPEPTRQLLRAFYKPHNEQLYRLLGQDFRWQ